VVASLEIQGVVAAGLVDKTWEWTEGPVQPGSLEIVQIPDPSLYQVTYGSDGTITYTADCNSGSMSYELNNAGMTGGMLAQPGPMTLAECGPESLSNSFISSLQASQDYRVWAGGNELELVLPAGGGTLLLRNANALDKPSAGGASVTGMVTNGNSAVIPEGATASIQIQDTSLADAAATVMGEQIIENPGQFPIAYQVEYDPSAIVDNHTYTMRARITAADGSLLFINDTAIPVITNGSPTEDVEIPVIQTGDSGGESAAVTGEVTYQQRIALPDDAVVTVQIQDTSLADAPATVIGEQIIQTNGAQVPIPYSVSYDPNVIDERFTYTMSARITNGAGDLLWINDTAIPVITNGNPTGGVMIPVVQVEG
jgi:putative lipoprotein